MVGQTTMRVQLGPHLPALRRYARAMHGSQRGGDAHVRAALEVLLAAPRSLPAGSTAKISLFRLLHAVSVGESGWASAREGLLLTAIEGFTLEEAAEILARPAPTVQQEIDAAKAQIAEAIRSRILIIEDEPVISIHLEQIVEDLGHTVSGTAMTRREAVAAARAEAPDMVLADIQLADGSSGIDAVADILSQFDVPVIFITSHPELLLTGERREPTFVITKPFDPDMVVATIGQALLARRTDLAPAA